MKKIHGQIAVEIHACKCGYDGAEESDGKGMRVIMSAVRPGGSDIFVCRSECKNCGKKSKASVLHSTSLVDTTLEALSFWNEDNDA